MLNIIQDIIFKSTGRRDVTIDTDFMKDLKLNSFDIINLVADFETRYNFAVPTRDLWKIHTVRDFVNYLSEKGIK